MPPKSIAGPSGSFWWRSAMCRHLAAIIICVQNLSCLATRHLPFAGDKYPSFHASLLYKSCWWYLESKDTLFAVQLDFSGSCPPLQTDKSWGMAKCGPQRTSAASHCKQCIIPKCIRDDRDVACSVHLPVSSLTPTVAWTWARLFFFFDGGGGCVGVWDCEQWLNCEARTQVSPKDFLLMAGPPNILWHASSSKKEETLVKRKKKKKQEKGKSCCFIQADKMKGCQIPTTLKTHFIVIVPSKHHFWLVQMPRHCNVTAVTWLALTFSQHRSYCSSSANQTQMDIYSQR